MKIGILSDTHGWIHPRISHYFSDCDEIWHAGDIGGNGVIDDLEKIAPVRAVHGNIDDASTRRHYPAELTFMSGNKLVYMTHIGGQPGRYSPSARDSIRRLKPAVVVCGHSHITLVKYDHTYNCLFINPGSSGYHGFHKMMTVIRINITGDHISDLEVIELGERGKAVI